MVTGERDSFTIMTFNPDANLNTLQADLAFMRRFAGNPLNFCRAEIYAGTPLEKRMIALGRARGDYRAREYSMYDPVADLACTISLDLFYDRCWGTGSLMQNTIGLDHMIAVRKRFHGRDDLCERAHAWVRAVNLDTLDLLEEVIELSAAGLGKMDATALRKIMALREREQRARQQFLREGLPIKMELDEFRLPGRTMPAPSTPRSRLGRQVAAAVLAIGVQATVPTGPTVAEPAPAPVQQTGGSQKQCCTLGGSVVDSMNAVMSNVEITVTNVATNRIVTLKTDEAGQFATKDLTAGKYDMVFKANGFMNVELKAVEVTEGEPRRLNIQMELANWGGCCEYAAPPMIAPEISVPDTIPLAGYSFKTKPFTYFVGEANDHGTLRGIAKLVYGDQRMWVWIFEANPDAMVNNPNSLPSGLLLTIPQSRQREPKLETKVLPPYPAEAAAKNIHGEVAMDVSLNDDGTVREVKAIEGNPLLDSAAVDAVKQWKYRPLTVDGKLVNRIVVVLTFEKSGKVH
jgi:TonB family protein